jgi:hypothetical protein
MKALSLVGLVVLILGIASFFVPFPHSENHGIKVGDASVGVQTHSSERISPVMSGVLIQGPPISRQQILRLAKYGIRCIDFALDQRQ